MRLEKSFNGLLFKRLICRSVNSSDYINDSKKKQSNNSVRKMIQLFNPFSKKDESDPEQGSMLSSLRTGILAKISPVETESSKTEEKDADETNPHTPVLSMATAKEVPDLDVVAGYILQFGARIGKIKPEHSNIISDDNLLDIRNFRSVLYFADWEFTRRHHRRLTDIIWYTSDYDYNINTASRFDVILDSSVFDFGYRTLGEKKSNHILTKISLRRPADDYDFAIYLDEETRSHLEHVVSAYSTLASRPRTFPASFEPKGGDTRTYYDLDLQEVASIERREHRVNVKPFMNLDDKKFDPATFAEFQKNVEFDFHRSFGDHDHRFAAGLSKVTGKHFFDEHPERLFIRTGFPQPLWETDDEISLMSVDEATGYGKEYMIRPVGKTSYIFAHLTDAEYAGLTDTQKEFFKIAPEENLQAGNSKASAGKERLIEFRGECRVTLDLHVVMDPTRESGVKTSFGEVKFRLL